MELLAVLKKILQHRCILVNLVKFLKTNFWRTLPYDFFWIEYKYNNTKMIEINININNFTPFHPSSLTSKCYSSLLLKTTFRSSCSQMFFKIGVLKNFAILTGKHLLWNNFIKMRLQLRVFSYKYRKIFKTSFFYSTTPMAVFGYLHYFLIPFSCYVHQ